jgi:hypothetical protein
MSEESNPRRGSPLESQSNGSQSAPAEEHKVGPGRPPPDKRWRKGGPSPNPRGRPRKEQSMVPDLRKVFEQAINKKVPVPRGDKKVHMTRVEIGFEQLLNQVAKGDRHARRDLLEYAAKLGIDLSGKHRQELEEALTPDYQAILEAFLARQNGGGDVAPAPRVLAPTELLDDDPAEGEATPPSPPKAETKPDLPEPTPVPGRKYPKPFKQMTPLQRQIYYQEWWAQYGEEWERRGRR